MRTTIILLLICQTIYGQYNHESVFPDLENDELNSALIDNYKPTISLSLSETRDTLYKKVFLHKDSVRCVYTTMAKFLDLNQDPSQFLFEEGGSDDLNLEHGFPQAKGAGFGAAQADMHHLFPSRVMVNSRRGNDPYVELDDNDVDTWYYKEEERSSRPNSSVIDQYSEDMHLGFEPREDFKGNVARAYFYFYTMYKQQADAEDPVFFSSQVETLCDWHDLDPVDSLEWVRTYKIANYQDDKPNPFVLDCRLARLYCNSVSQGCRTVDTKEVLNSDSKLVLSPNPIMAGGRIGLSIGADLGQGILSGLQSGRAVIFDFQGRKVSEQVLDGDFEIFAPGEVGYYQVFIFDRGVVIGRRSLVVY